MKQILQNLGNGETYLAELAVPQRNGNDVLIQTSRTLVSLGTERMLIDFGKGGWIAKARSQPDKVKQVLQKIKTDGLWATLEAVKSKLDTPIPLGYCHVGRVLESGPRSRYTVSQRVVSNGPHAEIVAVGENLVAAVPDAVSDEEAAFTVIGAIGLQGIRLLHPTLGERIVVSGLGLIGLMAVQMLRANGCQVLGIDFDTRKLELAKGFGAEICDLSKGQDPIRVAEQWTNGLGVDGVLITASTKSDELIHQASTMCRQRGRIVLVGVIGLHLQRADFYEKELTFQVSCSYGPGRYDPNYERRGLDYPIGFVRWTEQRNFEAVLQMMAEGKVNVRPLISHRFPFSDALRAYESIRDSHAMGILLEYDSPQASVGHISVQTADTKAIHQPAKRDADTKSRSIMPTARDIGVGFIGAGGFTTRTLMPLLPKTGIRRVAVSSSTGVSAAHAAQKFQFEKTVSRFEDILEDSSIDAVFITTPHHLHAPMVCRALDAGKHVFVEKPLGLTQDEIDLVKEAIEKTDRCLLVGFNRRFSPHLESLKEWIQSAPSNKAIIITVNAGSIPLKHWTQDQKIGGGRIVGEGCHFVDVARYLVGHTITHAQAFPVIGGDGRLGDCVTMQLSFQDGSTASIHYLSNGSKDFPKERIEVFAGGRVYVCDNFRDTREIGGRRRFRTRAQDKGHKRELDSFFQVIRDGGPFPIELEELLEVSRTTIDLASRSNPGCG